MIEKEFHAKPVEELVAGLQTDIEQGLTQREAQDRLRRYGSNELTEKPRPGFLALLWYAVTVWRRAGGWKATWKAKAWSALLLLSAATILWIALVYHLIGFATDY